MADVDQDLKDMGMPALRDEGAKHGLTFGAGTSKIDARAEIQAARDAAASSDENGSEPAGDPNVETDPGNEGAAPEQPPVEVETARPAKGDEVTITRTSPNAWWCPVCDHSNMGNVATCGGCGATRTSPDTVQV